MSASRTNASRRATSAKSKKPLKSEKNNSSEKELKITKAPDASDLLSAAKKGSVRKKTGTAASGSVSEKIQNNDVISDNNDSLVQSSEEKSAEIRSACKTPQVMKLVEQSIDVNPVLLAGKSRIPSKLRGKQSLTRIMRSGMGDEFRDDEGTVVVNITELAIEWEAPVVLDRFNACSCDKCVEIFSRIIAEKVPVRFARVNKNGRDFSNRELGERVEPMRKIVVSQMTRELIGSRKRCFHNDAEQ